MYESEQFIKMKQKSNKIHKAFNEGVAVAKAGKTGDYVINCEWDAVRKIQFCPPAIAGSHPLGALIWYYGYRLQWNVPTPFFFFFTLETRVKPEIEAINIGPLQYICKESLHLIQIMKFQFINIYKAKENHNILQSDKEIHK